MKEYVQSSAHDHPSLFMITYLFLFMVSLVLRPWDIIMVGYCNLSNYVKSSLPGVANATSLSKVIIPSEILRQDAQLNSAKCEERALNTNPSDGRVMLIDGTSIIYRSYFKLLGIL
ncbi:dna polymerase i [Fagus crenata]